jgi:ribulose kinase
LLRVSTSVRCLVLDSEQLVTSRVQELGPRELPWSTGVEKVRAALPRIRHRELSSLTVLAESTYATTTWRDERNADIFEQSTTESASLSSVLGSEPVDAARTVWSCIGKACKDVLRDAKVSKEQVKGIGFDATCSLAVCDTEGKPQSVTDGDWATGGDKRNVILWADHRAGEEAKLINSTDSMVLK